MLLNCNNEKEQTGKHLQPDVAYFVAQYVPLTAPLPSSQAGFHPSSYSQLKPD